MVFKENELGKKKPILFCSRGCGPPKPRAEGWAVAAAAPCSAQGLPLAACPSRPPCPARCPGPGGSGGPPSADSQLLWQCRASSEYLPPQPSRGAALTSHARSCGHSSSRALAPGPPQAESARSLCCFYYLSSPFTLVSTLQIDPSINSP